MKKSSPAVPSSPGFPFSAIPARSFLISAMALPGFKLWNVLKKPIFTRYVKWTCNEHYIHSTTSRVLDGIFSRSPIGSRSFVKIMSHIQSKLFNFREAKRSWRVYLVMRFWCFKNFQMPPPKKYDNKILHVGPVEVFWHFRQNLPKFCRKKCP